MAGPVLLTVSGLIWVGWEGSWEEWGRFLIAGLASLVMMGVFHYLRVSKAIPKKKVAFLGEHPLVKPILREIKNSPLPCYQVVLNGQGEDHPAFSSFEHLLRSLNGNRLHILLVSEAEAKLQAQRLFQGNGHRDVAIYNCRDFYELLTGKVLLPLEGDKDKVKERTCPILKRAFDLVMASTIAICFAPWALLITLIIRLTSKGPVLFRQGKVGFRGNPLLLLKFRSMVEGAEVMNGLHAVTKRNDSRITPFGKFLRLTHLDELPQIWLILKGEMSFIGPRPLNEYLEERLSREIPHHSLRYLTLPGLTGWAQINQPNSRSPEGQKKRLQFDLFYIRHRSLLIDAFISLKSFKIILSGFGAR